MNKVNTRNRLLVGSGVVLALVLAVGLAFASDAAPTEEPESSPFFEATLQQAVDELDGKAQPPAGREALQPQPTQHYTFDQVLWPECGESTYTWNVVTWPWCHFTSDPTVPDCDTPWPTLDYTWDSSLWPECDPTGVGITKDPTQFWCDPKWTSDVQTWPQCAPGYTLDPTNPLWCNPRYTSSPNLWPECQWDVPYTSDPSVWPECRRELTSDPYLWPECHFTSDPILPECSTDPPGYPTQDYTSNALYWKECDPAITSDPNLPECEAYTLDQQDIRCDPLYTSSPLDVRACHYTSDVTVPGCETSWPTMDFTWDAKLWPQYCGQEITYDANWWCDPQWTSAPDVWPGCDPYFTRQPDVLQCLPRYTYDPGLWKECDTGLYTYNADTWPECKFYTADARIWPECHYTSDLARWPECGKDPPVPTRDYTTDPQIWPECDVGVPSDYTTDPAAYPECHYTSDPSWPECRSDPQLGELGDAPDDTNHSAAAMNAYPGVLAKYPTVFDPATGLPQGPKHWYPRRDAWLGPWVTKENDADLMPDEEGVTNIDPPTDTPDRDGADDGLLYPVNLHHCTSTVISYTVTVSPGATYMPRYVNVWFDWNRDGDWQDTFTCPDGSVTAEWAVQNHVTNLGPGTHVLQTPAFLPYNPTQDDPMWMRITLAGQPAPLDPTTGRADGRGSPNGYRIGETEDYYLSWETEPDYDIYIKDNDLDDGSVPSSSPWWLSPDIWVRNDGDCLNSSHNNPTPGTTTTVCIRVRNRMATTVNNITVNAYWANAALALSWPASWSYIAAFNIPSLAGGATTVQSVSWTVPFITGHFCLLARADAPNDPIGSGPDTIVPVDHVPNNNNIAQKNTNIVAYPEVTSCGFYSTTVYTDIVYFDAVNTWNHAVTVDIQFTSSDFPLGTGTLTVDPSSLWGRWATPPTNFVQHASTLEATGFPATMSGIVMTPFETARISMTIAAEVDDKFTIDVTEYVSGTNVGGIQYVRDLPRCLYLPTILRTWAP